MQPLRSCKLHPGQPLTMINEPGPHSLFPHAAPSEEIFLNVINPILTLDNMLMLHVLFCENLQEIMGRNVFEG